MNNKKNIDDKIRDFLANDPVPELDDWEVKVLTQRVVARSNKKKPFTILGFKPAWGIGIAAAALLLFTAIHIAPPELNPSEKVYTEYVEETVTEDLLYEAIASGEIDEDAAIAGLIDVDETEMEEVYYSYTEDEIDAAVEILSDEEVENVLQYLSSLGYDGGEEVL